MSTGKRPWSSLAARAILRRHRGLTILAIASFALTSGAVTQTLWHAAAPDRLCRGYAGIPGDAGRKAGMAYIQGGRFDMGSDAHYAEEAPAHEVRLNGFWIDRHDVTNAQFARFAHATGYLTIAERPPDRLRHPDLPEAMQEPGSAVFVLAEKGRVGRWRYVVGANWRHPEGPGSSIEQIPNHPVVHVAYEDAEAYARWAGRSLPTEAQWEYAARGGLQGASYVWGDGPDPENSPQEMPLANTWQGFFPVMNTEKDGYPGTSPVGCYPANGYGLYDMAGNVWQWTSSWYRDQHARQAEDNPIGPEERDSFDPRQPGTPAKVIKGGSHLCAANYCARYRPAARQARETDSGTSHIGFRTVLNEPSP